MNVPDGWEVKKVSDCILSKNDKSKQLNTTEYLDTGKYPIVDQSKNFIAGYTNKISKLINIEEPIVIFGDHTRELKYINFDFCCGADGTQLIKNKNFIDISFLFYALENIDLANYGYDRHFKHLKNSNILIPKEKKEQEKIAKILSTLDKAIETTNRLIEKEKNIKKALMQELLTNGIDKDGHIRTRATHTYKESELGLIPDEWEVVSLGQITKIIGGGTPSRDIEEYWKNGTIPWVTVKDLHDGLLIKESEEYITEKGLESSATNLIKANNIITSTRMGIGRFYINEIDITINQDMKALFAKDSIDKQFLLWSLLHFGKKLEALGTGTTVKGILLNDLKSLKLILPLMTEQKQIAKILTKQDKKIETEETNLAKLKELKKGLMNDLLSGKVRVKV